MTIASFGNRVFRVSADQIETFKNMQTTSSIKVDKQESLGNKPSSYIKGLSLSTFSISTDLLNLQGTNAEKRYQDWIETLEAREPLPFILGGQPFLKTKWLLQSVSLKETIYDGGGTLISGVMDLSFEEFVRYGKKPVKKSGAGSGASQAELDKIYKALSPSEKSSLIRKDGASVASNNSSYMTNHQMY